MSLYNKVKVRVHVASFINDLTKKPHFFINIKNDYFRRNITITDVWMFSENSKWFFVNVYNSKRPLPVIITPQNEWETWITVSEVFPAGVNSVLVRLSNGRYLTSSKRKGISQSGMVLGGK